MLKIERESCFLKFQRKYYYCIRTKVLLHFLGALSDGITVTNAVHEVQFTNSSGFLKKKKDLKIENKFLINNDSNFLFGFSFGSLPVNDVQC